MKPAIEPATNTAKTPGPGVEADPPASVPFDDPGWASSSSGAGGRAS
jgi:hypothetical protein